MRNPETNPISLFFNTIMKNHIGLIATLLVITSCIIWISGDELPPVLERVLLVVVAFLFGSKVGNSK